MVSRYLNYFLVLIGVRKNASVGFHLVTQFAHWLMPDYKFTWPELSWFHDQKLINLLGQFEETKGFNAHRRLALQQLLRLTINVPGDTAECGVYKGFGSLIILQASPKNGGSFSKTHHIFDSFEGLSAPSAKDSAYWKAGDLSAGEEIVVANLAGAGDFRVYKGWIPTRFSEVEERKFSFVHVDVDLYEPTYQSIAFFYGRLNTGGLFVCDDYGFLTCPGATSAIDEFLGDKPEKMIYLAGGGGFFIKGCVTAGN